MLIIFSQTQVIRLYLIILFQPARLWTGKQVFSMLLNPSGSNDEVINLTAKAKRFKAPKALDMKSVSYHF